MEQTQPPLKGFSMSIYPTERLGQSATALEILIPCALLPMKLSSDESLGLEKPPLYGVSWKYMLVCNESSNQADVLAHPVTGR